MTLNKNILGFLAISIICFLSALPAVAETEKPEVSFAIIELTPYGMRGDDGLPTGYFWESAQALLEETGLTYSLSLLPLKRMIKEVEAEREDCVFIARTHLAEKLVRFLEPIGQDVVAGIVPAAGDAIRKFDDLLSHTIGVPIGVIFHKQFETDDRLDRVRTVDYSTSVEMLIRNRVTAIAGNLGSFRYFAAKSGRDPDKVFGEPLLFNKIPIWLACGKTTPDDNTMNRLAAAMRDLREKGVFKAIIKNINTRLTPFFATGFDEGAIVGAHHPSFTNTAHKHHVVAHLHDGDAFLA